MKFGWMFILIVPVALALAWSSVARDAREQTVFLERIAETAERAQTIPPETEQAIRRALVSLNRRAPRGNEQLEARQQSAIKRIEAVLSSTNAVRTGGIVSRNIAHERPTE